MAEDVITTGFTIAWPWLLLLAPVPWLLRLLLPASPSGDMQALRVPWFSAVAGGKAGWMRRPWLALAAVLVWLLLVTAAARPQWIGEIESLPVTGRDLLLAVDISGSMDTQDMILNKTAVNRLKVVKKVAGEFIQRRHGDRVGLILFGSRAYLQTPLTFDTQTTATLLDESEIGLAGRETAIGDAIGLAVKRLRMRPQEDKILILLTDGANNVGEVAPEKAAELAAFDKIKIYTIGVGAEEMRVPSLLGLTPRVTNPSADLDEDTLQAVASTTGGRYFRAKDTQGLAEIYDLIDELEPIDQDPETYRPIQALYYWPMGAALLMFALFLATDLKGRKDD